MDQKQALLLVAAGALLGAHAGALASWARGLFLQKEEEEKEEEKEEEEEEKEKEEEKEENSRYMEEALALSKAEVLALRAAHFCAAQSVSYITPSHLTLFPYFNLVYLFRGDLDLHGHGGDLTVLQLG